MILGTLHHQGSMNGFKKYLEDVNYCHEGSQSQFTDLGSPLGKGA